MTRKPDAPDNVTVTRELVRLAIVVALSAPYRQSNHAVMATVPWHAIHQLRVELSNNGVTWQNHHPQRRK